MPAVRRRIFARSANHRPSNVASANRMKWLAAAAVPTLRRHSRQAAPRGRSSNSALPARPPGQPRCAGALTPTCPPHHVAPLLRAAGAITILSLPHPTRRRPLLRPGRRRGERGEGLDSAGPVVADGGPACVCGEGRRRRCCAMLCDGQRSVPIHPLGSSHRAHPARLAVDSSLLFPPAWRGPLAQPRTLCCLLCVQGLRARAPRPPPALSSHVSQRRTGQYFSLGSHIAAELPVRCQHYRGAGAGSREREPHCQLVARSQSHTMVDTDAPPADTKKTRIILSLDGGGIRGVLICKVLMYLQNQLKKTATSKKARHLPLCDWFDMIAGTSTGAIIGAAMNLEDDVTGQPMYTAGTLLDFYLRLVGDMFTPPGTRPRAAMQHTSLARAAARQCAEELPPRLRLSLRSEEVLRREGHRVRDELDSGYRRPEQAGRRGPIPPFLQVEAFRLPPQDSHPLVRAGGSPSVPVPLMASQARPQP
eukprot:scaffold1351_cov359-Prasinococcus_capsulatus_cf.AAC.7